MTKRRHAVLVVEDHDELRDAICMTLDAAGYLVWTARDGLDAQAILLSLPIDLILSDISMPRMDGNMLYEWVRQQPQWASRPFLFLTYFAPEEALYAHEVGSDRYLTKPIEPEDILEAVRRSLASTSDGSEQLC